MMLVNKNIKLIRHLLDSDETFILDALCFKIFLQYVSSCFKKFTIRNSICIKYKLKIEF